MDKFFGSFYVKYLPLKGLEPFLVFNGRGFAWSGESAVGTESTPYNRSDAKSKASRQSNFRKQEFKSYYTQEGIHMRMIKAMVDQFSDGREP